MNTDRFHNLKQWISRKRKPLLVLLLLLVFWFNPVSIGIVYNHYESMCAYQFGWYTALDPNILRDVAIVTSVNKIGNRSLQQKVVEKLAKSLADARPAKDAAGHPLSCKVTIYTDLNKAITAKPSMYLIVRAPELSYLPVFMWKAIVQIDGATTSDRARFLLNPDAKTKSFSLMRDIYTKDGTITSKPWMSIVNGKPRSLTFVERHLKEKAFIIEHKKGKPETRTLNDGIFISTSFSGKGLCVMNLNYLVSYISDLEVNETTKMLWSGVYGKELRN